MFRRMLSGMIVLAALGPSLLATGGAAASGPALKATWDQADHASGIYHAKGAATLNVYIENTSDEEQPLDGDIAFGNVIGAKGEFKALSITPIAATNLGAKQRAKIPLKVDFAAAGQYQLRWQRGDQHAAVDHSEQVKLQAIFAPRGGDAVNPWITILPEQAGRVPDFLQDYAVQTSVRRFLMNDRFSFDSSTRIGFAPGMGRQMKQISADLAKAKGSLVIRVTVPLGPERTDAVKIEGFRKWVASACADAKGTLQGLVIAPEQQKLTAQEREDYRQLYLAAYEESKKHDKTIVMLGTGSAVQTRDLLGDDLLKYVDAIAVSDAVGQPAIARKLLGDKAIIWALPPVHGDWNETPAAAALAESVTVAPAPSPDVDRGVTAHLLGGAVLLQRIHPQSLPFIAVFQGDGYAVAAVAGLSAHTPIDALYPALARSKTSVVPPGPEDDRPPYPHLEVSDDTESVRVVDAAGAPVDCREGDTLYVPAADRIVYVLENGHGEDLAAILRPATANRLPLMEVTASAVELAGKKNAITLKLTNISTDELGGTAKIVLPPTPERKEAVVLAEKSVVAISPGKNLELTLTLEGDIPPGAIIIELVTDKGTQRTAAVVGK